jgi:hypothetical protein
VYLKGCWHARGHVSPEQQHRCTSSWAKNSRNACAGAKRVHHPERSREKRRGYLSGFHDGGLNGAEKAPKPIHHLAVIQIFLNHEDPQTKRRLAMQLPNASTIEIKQGTWCELFVIRASFKQTVDGGADIMQWHIGNHGIRRKRVRTLPHALLSLMAGVGCIRAMSVIVCMRKSASAQSCSPG